MEYLSLQLNFISDKEKYLNFTMKTSTIYLEKPCILNK